MIFSSNLKTTTLTLSSTTENKSVLTDTAATIEARE